MRNNRHYVSIYIFSVDCSEAGNGDLEIFVKNDKGRVPSFCSDNGRGIYNVHFTPYLKGPHYVSVNFNRAEIRGWFLKLQYFDNGNTFLCISLFYMKSQMLTVCLHLNSPSTSC